MLMFYFVISALVLVILGLIGALVLQQWAFLKAREALEQKLIARDLPEYVEQKLMQKSEVDPEEEEEEDIYVDIDQLSPEEGEAAMVQHLNQANK